MEFLGVALTLNHSLQPNLISEIKIKLNMAIKVTVDDIITFVSLALKVEELAKQNGYEVKFALYKMSKLDCLEKIRSIHSVLNGKGKLNLIY